MWNDNLFLNSFLWTLIIVAALPMVVILIIVLIKLVRRWPVTFLGILFVIGSTSFAWTIWDTTVFLIVLVIEVLAATLIGLNAFARSTSTNTTSNPTISSDWIVRRSRQGLYVILGSAVLVAVGWLGYQSLATSGLSTSVDNHWDTVSNWMVNNYLLMGVIAAVLLFPATRDLLFGTLAVSIPIVLVLGAIGALGYMAYEFLSREDAAYETYNASRGFFDGIIEYIFGIDPKS